MRIVASRNILKPAAFLAGGIVWFATVQKRIVGGIPYDSICITTKDRVDINKLKVDNINTISSDIQSRNREVILQYGRDVVRVSLPPSA